MLMSNAERKLIKFSDLGEFFNRKPSAAKLRKMYSLPANNVSRDVKMAMDSTLEVSGHFSAIERFVATGGIDTLPQFLGYAYLAGLQQNGFIRAGVEGLADDMTESWVELTRCGDAETLEEKDKVKALTSLIDEYSVRAIFNKAASLCGYFGGCLVFIDDGSDELDLKSAMDTKNLEIKALIPIEPINVYPGFYNSTNPLRGDYYNPKTWYVLGREVHVSRLLYFTFDDLSVLLKPAYNFFGVAPAQIAVDSVSHFIKDKEAASRLLHKFSLLIFKTDMGSALYNGNPEELYKRIKLLADLRNNDSIVVADKEEEDIVQITTALGGVTDIVRQSLELMPIMFRQPLTKFLGIAPGGLNATGESDENNWNQYVLSQNEKIFRTPLKKLIDLFQYQLWGEVDNDISFAFKKRSSRDVAAGIANNKVKADIDAIYLANGVLSGAEVRNRLVDDPESGYNSIDADDVPENVDDEPPADNGGTFDPFAIDEWKEDNHPRDKFGKFGSGGGESKNESSNGEVKAEKHNQFGTPYNKYSGDSKSAIAFLMEIKNGYVPKADYKEKIGYIDFVWGDDEFGLQHLLKQRKAEGYDGEKILKLIPDIIKKGTVKSESSGRKAIIWNKFKLIIVQEESNWILTGFETGYKKA